MMGILYAIVHPVAQFVCQCTEARCLSVDGEALGLCVRCTGVYAGIALMLGALFGVRRLRRARLGSGVYYAAYAGLGMMGLAGGIAAWGGVDEPTWVRLETGIVFGASIAVLAKERLAAWMGMKEEGEWGRREWRGLGVSMGLIAGLAAGACCAGTWGVRGLGVVSGIGCLATWGGLGAMAAWGIGRWCVHVWRGLATEAQRTRRTTTQVNSRRNCETTAETGSGNALRR